VPMPSCLKFYLGGVGMSSKRMIIREFRDEDRFFGFLKKKSVVYFLVGLGVLGIFFKLATRTVDVSYGLIVVGVVLLILITGFGTVTIPSGLYMYGGGQDLDGLLVNLVLHKMRRAVYTKAYGFDSPKQEKKKKHQGGK